jgi:urease accessory protein
MSIEVGPGAMAMLSTQAATKVYRSPSGTSSELTAHVAAGGLLVSAPDAVVCFAQARYRQVQEFHLEGDADLVSVDWLSAGRCARGERWAFDEYRNRLRIHAAGELVCHEAVTLRAADADLADRFGRFDALATIALVGPRLRGHAERLLADHDGMPPARHADRLSVVAPLAGGGCLVRMAGVSLEDIGRAIRDCLHNLPAVLGDDPWARKW